MAEAEAPILWPTGVNSWLIRKDSDAGKDWRQEEKGITEDGMVGWHHQLSGHEFEQTLGDSEGQGSLVGCSPWGQLQSWMLLSDWTTNHHIALKMNTTHAHIQMVQVRDSLRLSVGLGKVAVLNIPLITQHSLEILALNWNTIVFFIEWMKTNIMVSAARLPSDDFTTNELFNHGQIYLIYASICSFVKVIINNSIGGSEA